MEETAAPGGSTGLAEVREGPRRRWGALLALCLPVFAVVVVAALAWGRERRLAAECRRRIELLGEAAEKYATAGGGRYPYDHPRTARRTAPRAGRCAARGLVLRYLRHERFLFCPKHNIPYRWTSRERKQGDPAHLLLAWETRPHGMILKRRHALFVGGRVKALGEKELLDLLAGERREPLTPPQRPPRPRPGLRSPPDAPPPRRMPRLPPGVQPPKFPGPADRWKGSGDVPKKAD